MKINENNIAETVYWSSKPGKFVESSTGKVLHDPVEVLVFQGTMAGWYDSLTYTIESIGVRNGMVGNQTKLLVSNHVWDMVLSHTSWAMENKTQVAEKVVLTKEIPANTFYLIDKVTDKLVKFVVLDMQLI